VSVTFVGINDEIAPCKGDLERKTLASFVLAITCYWRGRRSITQHKHNVRERRNLTSFDGKVIFKLVIVSSNIDLVSWFEDYWLSRALYLRGIGWSKVIIGVFERISSVVYLI